MNKRILYITNLPAPYKVEFFNELGRYVDLTVAFERTSARNRSKSWVSQQTHRNYHEIWLSGLSVGDEKCLSFDIIPHLKKTKYDLVLLNGYSSPAEMIAIQYMKSHGVKFGLVCDGLLEKEESAVKKQVKTYLVSAASFWLSSGKLTDKVLVSHGAEPSRIFRYPFSSISKADIVSVPYDRKYYKECIGCKSKYMILYVGQMIHRKGIDVLQESIKGIELDFQLYMIGGEAAAVSSNTVNIGFVDKGSLMNYYKAADAFVLPSREDIWGLVINEAMGCGVPVIATDRCGAALEMILDGQNGAIVQAENTSMLRERISDILLNSDSESLMSCAVETAKNYTIERMADCIWKVICQCC